MRRAEFDRRRPRATRRLGLGAVGLSLAASLGACDRGPATQPTAEPTAEPIPEASPLEPVEASNRSEGEVIDLTLVRPDGSTTELSTMRGGPVLLVVDASWSEDWAEGLEVYPDLIERYELEIVMVVADQDPAVTDGMESANLHVAWDPQGAVAAKLSAATFPTLILLDPEGRVRWQAKGLDVSAVRQALDAG